MRPAIMGVWIVFSGVAQAAQPSGGEALFAKHCGACHAASDVIGQLKTTAAHREQAKASMRAFLTAHGEADEKAAREIVDYLALQANP